jgi:pimeloyl-ACP methyl ester carboxylesterase
MLAGERTFAGRIPVDAERVRGIATRAWHRSAEPAAAGNHWLAVGGEGENAPPPDVTTISAPTLVVHGDADPLFPLPHGEALAEAVPGARLLVVPGLGHQVPPPETWDVVVPALLEHTADR